MDNRFDEIKEKLSDEKIKKSNKETLIQELLQKDFLSGSEVATVLDVSRQTISNLKKEKKLIPKSVVSGNIFIYSTKEVVDYKKYIRKKQEDILDEFYYNFISLTSIHNTLKDRRYIIKRYIKQGLVRYKRMSKSSFYVLKKDFDAFAKEVYNLDTTKLYSGRQLCALFQIKAKEFDNIVDNLGLQIYKKHKHTYNRIFVIKDIEKVKKDYAKLKKK